MKKVKCNICEEMVARDDAYMSYIEGYDCLPCIERLEIQADEGLTVEERSRIWD